MNMSKLPDREDMYMLSSDKIVKAKKLYSNIRVAFEVNLSSEGDMDANYVNITYTLYFFDSKMLQKTELAAVSY